MPAPFPGMTPYLENSDLGPEVHHLLISLLAETLNPQLLPTYRLVIEERVYQLSSEDALLTGIPAVAIALPMPRLTPVTRDFTIYVKPHGICSRMEKKVNE